MKSEQTLICLNLLVGLLQGILTAEPFLARGIGLRKIDSFTCPRASAVDDANFIALESFRASKA
jgi:hypothetical protein